MEVELPQDRSSNNDHQENLDLFHVAFGAPDLTTFCRLDERGLVVVGQRPRPDRAVIECRVVGSDRRCRGCGGPGAARGTVTRRSLTSPLEAGRRCY